MSGMKPSFLQKMRMEADDKPSFDGWLIRVDSYLMNGAGVAHTDFPEHNFKFWFDTRMDPKWVAQKVIGEI
jgi:hypothetical protein